MQAVICLKPAVNDSGVRGVYIHAMQDLESLPVSNAPFSLVPNIAALPMSMDLEGIGLLGFIPDADDIPDLPMLDGSEPMLDDSELKRFNFD